MHSAMSSALALMRWQDSRFLRDFTGRNLAWLLIGASLGDEGKDRMNKLSEENVASVEGNLFMVNPDWSYVEKSWADADPQYWGGEPAHKPAAETAPAPKVSPTH